MLKKVNPLYDVCNQLNSQGYQLEFQLPIITVTGSQSTGKTSVLESICEEGFLPKGDNIQTRCPIMLQLRHAKGWQNETFLLQSPTWKI